MADVPGLVRRIRRTADLSQRDLADRLAVSQSTVAQWESGQQAPGLSAFLTLVGLVGGAVQVVDESGEPLEPMRPDGVRDAADRRYPAHLDPEPIDRSQPERWDRPYRDVACPRRWRRDRPWRPVAGAARPYDHPTRLDVSTELRNRRAERVARAALEARERASRWPPEPDLPCACPVDCEEGGACPSTCPCGCEVGFDVPLIT